MDHEIATEIAKAVPPVGVSVTCVLGVSLSDWVCVATIIYFLVMSACLIRKNFFKRNDAK